MTNQTRLENWADVDGWPYEVSDLGNIRRKGGANLRPWKFNNGYLGITLVDAPRRLTARLHKVVALAFLGDPPTGKTDVAHGDGNKENNAVSNLRWASSSENHWDKDRHGRMYHGARHHRATITETEAVEIAKSKEPSASLARRFRVSRSIVNDVRTGRTWWRVTGLQRCPHTRGAVRV